MGKPLKVVVVGSSRNEALRVAADIEQCGFDPSFSLVSTGPELGDAVREGCDVVMAWRGTSSLPTEQALESVRGTRAGCPVLVYADSYREEEIVALMRAGAADCLRKGDLERLRATLERELEQGPRRRDGGGSRQVEAGDQYRALIEEIPALTYVAWADETGSRAYVSPQLLGMTGFTPGEWLSEPDMWVRRLHPRDRERVLREFRQACASTGRFASEYRILDKDGRELWWRDEGRALPGPDGTTRFVRGFVLDVTEQKIAEREMRRLRYYDQLTGLPNRDLFLKRLGRSLAESTRSGQPLALLILALHGFRRITNTLGHHNGDLIVRELAARLGDVLGGSDQVARLKGDEFGMLLPNADAELAARLADGTLAALEKSFMVQKLPIEVTASVGLAIAPEHGSEAEIVLRRADAALQAALKLGGGASVTYSEQYEPHDPSRLALLGELRQALDAKQQLMLYYQPKVDLKTRTVIGTEALLRWFHPKRGLVPPGEFIGLAEQGTGLMRPLTRWVIDRAVAEAKGKMGNGHVLPVAVNVSARNLHDDRVVSHIQEALEAYDMPADCLQLEVTESAVMEDPYRALETLTKLRELGLSIAVDDFGKGASSLGLLRNLPVTELKIDGSFVRGMVGEGGEGDTAIVRSTSEMAHNLGLSVVAEGVEDQWTLDTLSNFGCDRAQGFFIARPMEADDVMAWLEKSDWNLPES